MLHDFDVVSNSILAITRVVLPPIIDQFNNRIRDLENRLKHQEEVTELLKQQIIVLNTKFNH